MKYLIFSSCVLFSLSLFAKGDGYKCNRSALPEFSFKQSSSEEKADFFHCLAVEGAHSASVPYLISLVERSNEASFQESYLKVILNRVPREYEAFLYKKLKNKKLKISTSLRSDLFYYFALHEFDKGRISKALVYLNAQDRLTHFSKKAQSKFLEAVILVKKNKLDAAKNLFADVAKNKFKMERGPLRDKLTNASHLNVARVLMAQDKHKEAIESYRLVSFRDGEWFDGLIEMSWTMLSKEDHEDAIGNAEFVNKTTRNSIYKPWIPVIQSVGLLKLCQFPESKKTLKSFKSNYAKTTQKVKKVLDSRPSTNWYEFLSEIYDIKINKNTLALYPSVLFYAARNVKVMRIQERINELAQEEENLKNLIRSARKHKGSYVYAFLQKKLSRMNKLINKYEVAAGKRFKAILSQTLKEHKKLEKIADIVDFEIFSRSSKNITLRVAGAEFDDKLKTTERDKTAWAYIGEFWVDEVGKFRSFVANNCPVQDKAQKSIKQATNRK